MTHPGKWLREQIERIFNDPPGSTVTLDELKRQTLRAADEATRNVKMIREVKADGVFESMKLGAYRVRDPETGEFGPTQFHMTHGNYVLAVMGESSATLFANFVFDTLGQEKCISEVAAKTRASLLREATKAPANPTPQQVSEGAAVMRSLKEPPTTPKVGVLDGWHATLIGREWTRDDDKTIRIVGDPKASLPFEAWRRNEFCGSFDSLHAAIMWANEQWPCTKPSEDPRDRPFRGHSDAERAEVLRTQLNDERSGP